MSQNTNIFYFILFPADGIDKEKQQPDKKPKLSFGMMKKSLPAKSGIKITLNNPATVSIFINVKCYEYILRFK
jgi:hypothetical protein